MRVTHLHLGEPLAIKILSPEAAASPEVHARFRWEAQSAVRLRGEHVARVIDVGLLPDGAPYLVMEYLRGLDLAGELARRRTLLPGEAVDYVLQASEALAEAHAHGIVHRDVKPSNLFLTARPDGTPLIKVLDFGISKATIAHDVLGRTDVVMGTPGYMSPEQMSAIEQVDARSDIWALGVVLYEFLMGRRPFDAAAYATVAVMVATEPPPAMDSRVPPALQAIVMRCLEKDPSARFPAVAALAAALAPFAHDQRAAALIVERTNRMSRGVLSAIEATAPALASMATTLSGSAGASVSLSRRRRYGIIALVGSIVGVSAAALIVASGAGTPSAEPAGRPPQGRVAATSPPAVSGTRSMVATTVDAAAPPPIAEDRDAEAAHKAAACTALLTQRKWQALETCASELDTLGGTDQAKEFRATASQESLNEAEDGNVRRALHGGDLRAADASFQLITADSIYIPALRDAFGKAEAKAMEDARRTAQGLARARDCVALRRLVAQLAASTTERVAAAAQTVRCGDRTAAAEPPRVSAAVGAAASTSQRPVSTSAVPPKGCDATNADDLMIRAATQFDAGNAKAALSLAVLALGCKQTGRMYWLAVLYACTARDLASAKLYFREVPANLQPGIERKCQQEELDVRSR